MADGIPLGAGAPMFPGGLDPDQLATLLQALQGQPGAGPASAGMPGQPMPQQAPQTLLGPVLGQPPSMLGMQPPQMPAPQPEQPAQPPSLVGARSPAGIPPTAKPVTTLGPAAPSGADDEDELSANLPTMRAVPKPPARPPEFGSSAAAPPAGTVETGVPALTGPASSASKPNGPQVGASPADDRGFDLGGLLKRAGDAGLGDYLMALGGGIASGRNWSEGLGNAFSAASRVGTQQQASRLADAEYALKAGKARQEQGALGANATLIKQAFPNLSDEQAMGGASNSSLVSAAIAKMQNPNAGRDIRTDSNGVPRFADTGAKVFADDEGKDDRTAEVKNYQEALKGGFVGSLADFMNRNQNPDVKSFTLSDGSKVDRVFDPATKSWKDPNFGDNPPRVAVTDNSDVPPGVDAETFRKELAKGAAAEQKGASQRALQASNAMPVLDRAQGAYERLAQNGGIGPISASGPSRMIAGAFGRQNEIDRQDYEAAAKDLELLKAQISMKGQGAITEGERRLLGMTLPRLDAASPETGLTTLKGMRDQFTRAMGAQGLPTVGGGQQAPQQAPQPATASPQSVAPAARFQALTRGGMSKTDAFARMRQEGY
ncbi:hypothetical protein M6G65_33155 (plasmid) [Methylobacterium tardum]|uniref:hypothetical protein n=1 Tax=Methylobacterium tardum TaxID=374432 RepID=UPI0020223991|nr:hypothetical protein [Methylobacterium tardum]URD40298.1 hypothetical protein M6G65_33155 [Methylobacterium tardum]